MTPRVFAALSSRLGPWKPRIRDSDVRKRTSISSKQWCELAGAYPDLGRDPGPRAVRARLRMSGFSSRALQDGRWKPLWAGGEPSPDPTVYVTAHIGSIQAIRYLLRSRGVPAAGVLAPYNFDRAGPEADDARFDRCFPLEFPHVLSSAAPHRLRGALRAGSLIVAADLPDRDHVDVPLLGGTVRLDPRPFQLARMAGRPCRAVFLTLPQRRWQLTLGPTLPAQPRAALEGFAQLFRQVAAAAPLDLDGFFYWNLIRGRA